MSEINYKIFIEDIVSNAFIEKLKKENCEFLSFDEIEDYGKKAISLMHSKGLNATLVLSRDLTSNFFEKYSEFFEEKVVDGLSGVQLKDNVCVNDLINEFRGHLPIDMLVAFLNTGKIKEDNPEKDIEK